MCSRSNNHLCAANKYTGCTKFARKKKSTCHISCKRVVDRVEHNIFIARIPGKCAMCDHKLIGKMNDISSTCIPGTCALCDHKLIEKFSCPNECRENHKWIVEHYQPFLLNLVKLSKDTADTARDYIKTTSGIAIPLSSSELQLSLQLL
ncbi:hypothetical protein BMW23_0679 [Bodo saltans virus]|uniref:Uncharacterized protein n=1 Tax=Bodo saltans virus TaxID=2024608 RepID=A0A2H4UV67_9VIRU|nr:hypothetical protein QJ851_gp0662 [Bodo saltans virus]ATZ80725.1 hypothetical protein BMW23_0679 [Bodo saltans virus]